MIITVKTLQQKTFKIEIEETETVAVLKQKIEESEGPNFAAANQKLIYSGKILADAQPISDYNIQPSNFVVVMVSKAKPTQPAATKSPSQTSSTSSAPSTSGASASGSTTSSTVPPPTTATTTTTSTSTATTATTGPPSSTPSTSSSTVQPMETTDSGSTPSSGEGANWEQASSVLVTGTDYEAAVTNLIGLGFDRESVVRALRASFNNPDRAVEYLMGEIPFPSVEEPTNEGPAPPTQQAPPTQSSSQPPPTGSGVGGASSGSQPAPGGRSGGSPLAQLSQLPQFALLRQHIQSNPAMLQPLLEQIGQANPELLQIISQNQQEFLALLNEPAGGEEVGGEGVGPAEGGMMMPPHPGPTTIQVTAEEKEAIDRLKALGFSEAMAVQAYFACDKNEELAANFLFQQMDD